MSKQWEEAHQQRPFNTHQRNAGKHHGSLWHSIDLNLWTIHTLQENIEILLHTHENARHAQVWVGVLNLIFYSRKEGLGNTKLSFPIKGDKLVHKPRFNINRKQLISHIASISATYCNRHLTNTASTPNYHRNSHRVYSSTQIAGEIDKKWVTQALHHCITNSSQQAELWAEFSNLKVKALWTSEEKVWPHKWEARYCADNLCLHPWIWNSQQIVHTLLILQKLYTLPQKDSSETTNQTCIKPRPDYKHQLFSCLGVSIQMVSRAQS